MRTWRGRDRARRPERRRVFAPRASPKPPCNAHADSSRDAGAASPSFVPSASSPGNDIPICPPPAGSVIIDLLSGIRLFPAAVSCRRTECRRSRHYLLASSARSGLTSSWSLPGRQSFSCKTWNLLFPRSPVRPSMEMILVGIKMGHGVAVAHSQSGSFLRLRGRKRQALSWWQGRTQRGWGSVRGGQTAGSSPGLRPAGMTIGFLVACGGLGAGHANVSR